MTPASLLAEYAGLPLYVQLMLALVAGSGLACLGVVGVGSFFVGRRKRQIASTGLPALPSTFPYALDQLYTALFLFLLLWAAGAGLLPEESAPEAKKAPLSWSSLLLGVALQIGLYLPMLLRYGLLHPWQRPTRPWWHCLTLPLLFWAIIYLSVGMLEASGFSPWLIRVTQCPEHQELVLIFSRGDMMERLYIIICAIVVAPVAEECCFRGFLYTTLKRWGGCVAAALASALLFGAIHASLAQMVPLTLFGIAQCIAYEKARSLWLPIAIHMLFNTTSLIATAITLP